ncbi:MAG: semialdehyde dehydrogenase [Intrasporangium sp.]|uniref:semialdehyde dehydrogenase n=1 Tax=Intrasporangium sp. TaxID=1925024 RepID=UPI0026490C64|nr:semialdehyde dehydrogenase [Intrasporangium sp.]MDN5794782.1 semialdehyde dehydrogenase [Intrasporangium sp.]
MERGQGFAFLVHPRARLAEDLGRVWSPLDRVPERFYHSTLRRLALPPIPTATIEVGGEQVGHVILVPMGARRLLEHPLVGRERVAWAVDRAATLGVGTVGLGGLTATVTDGGRWLCGRASIGVTNGNAFTAATLDAQVRRLLGEAVHPDADHHVGIVGATGGVGTALVRLLTSDAAVDRLTLVDRSTRGLASLAGEVSSCAWTRISDDVSAVADADLVVLLTVSAGTVLRPEHLAPGAVVLDATQPRYTSLGLREQRPDVLVVDGGIVEIPSLRLHGGSIGLPDGRAHASFAEAALLALSGHRGDFSIGTPVLELVEQTRELAHSFSGLGFQPAEPTSFGEPLVLPHATASPTGAHATARSQTTQRRARFDRVTAALGGLRATA